MVSECANVVFHLQNVVQRRMAVAVQRLNGGVGKFEQRLQKVMRHFLFEESDYMKDGVLLVSVVIVTD